MPPKASAAEARDIQPIRGERIEDHDPTKVQKGAGKVASLRLVSVGEGANFPKNLETNFPSQELFWGD